MNRSDGRRTLQQQFCSAKFQTVQVSDTTKFNQGTAACPQKIFTQKKLLLNINFFLFLCIFIVITKI
jgi:hypothetical protein